MKLLTFWVLFFLLSSNLWAALIEVQHKTNSVKGGTNSSLSTTISATGSGNLLVAGVITAQNTGSLTLSQAISVTDGANNFMPHPASANDPNSGQGGAIQVSVWYLPVSAGGKTTITVNVSPSAWFLSLEVWEVSGFKHPTPDGAGQALRQTSVSGTDTGAAVTTTGDKEFLVAIDEIAGAVTANPKAGNEFTSGGDIDAQGANGFVSLITTSAGSHQPQWTESGGLYDAVTGAFRESYIRLNHARIANSKLGN